MGSYPGWTTGNNAKGITIEIFEDLLCSSCAYNHGIWAEVWETEWQGALVKDQVVAKITPFALPYHLHTFQVAQVIPYMNALCTTSGGDNCLQNQYATYCYDNYSTVLKQTDVSLDAFQTSWAQTVSTEFDLPLAEVQSIYASDDPYDTNHKVRNMWKYGVQKGVNWTPTIFVNGALLYSNPSDVNDWIALLDELLSLQPVPGLSGSVALMASYALISATIAF